MITLYDAELSGNCYKVRLLLALLGLEHAREPIDLAAGENRTEAFLRLNPRGQIPVLTDGPVTVWDSQAILVYLARRYATPGWLPLAAEPLAEVMQWLAFAGNECLFGMARARAIRIFGRPGDLAECQEYARRGLAVLDAHLAGRDWLAGPGATIADLACYPYCALVPAGGIALDPYRNARAWMARIEALPGYVGMPGIEAQRGT